MSVGRWGRVLCGATCLGASCLLGELSVILIGDASSRYIINLDVNSRFISVLKYWIRGFIQKEGRSFIKILNKFGLRTSP